MPKKKHTEGQQTTRHSNSAHKPHEGIHDVFVLAFLKEVSKLSDQPRRSIQHL
jgi:hypothetical protein